MAGLFYLGPLECDNNTCKEKITDYMLDHVAPNSIAGIRRLELLFATFPVLNLAKEYVNGCWKGLQFLLVKNYANSSNIIAAVINSSISPQLHSHFFQEFAQILKDFMNNTEVISFKFPKMRVHEACEAARCHKFPCCSRNTCDHSDLTTKEQFKTSFKHEDSIGRIELLIYSLLRIVHTTPIWRIYKTEFIKLLFQATIHDQIKISCLRVLCALSEYRIDLLENLDILETYYIRHISPGKLVETVKLALIQGQNCSRLSEYCSELLKTSVVYKDTSGIDNIIKSGKALTFCLMIFKHHLGMEFTEYIKLIDNSISPLESSSKKLIGNDNQVVTSARSLEIHEQGPETNLKFFDLLREAIYTNSSSLISFWYALTRNTFLGQITEKTSEISRFHIYLGYTAPTSLSSLVESFPYTYRITRLSGFFNSTTSFLDINHLLCMAPLHAVMFSVKEVWQFGVKIVNLIIDAGIRPPGLEEFSGKAIGAQFEGICRGIARLIEFIGGLNNSQEQAEESNWKFGEGFDGICMYCGDTAEKFCYGCGRVLFPAVYPMNMLPHPIFKLTNPIPLSIPFKLSDKLPPDLHNLSLTRALEYLETKFTASHSCADLITDYHSFEILALLKYIAPPPTLPLPLSCITLPKCEVSLLQNISAHPLLYKLYANHFLDHLNLSQLTRNTVKTLIRAVIWPCTSEILLRETFKGLHLLHHKYQVRLDEAIHFLGEEKLLEWTQLAAQTSGFLCRVHTEVPFSFPGLLLLVQPLLMIKMEYLDMISVLTKLCEEFESPLILFYTNIISEIAWTGEISRLKSLEDLASRILRGSEGSSISITDIFQKTAEQNYQVALLLLLCKLGLGKYTSDWLISCKFNTDKVSMQETDRLKFFNGYEILTNIFHTTEALSQHTQKSLSFSWEEYFTLAHVMEERAFPEKAYKVNSLLGLARLSIHFLEEEHKHVEYLIHKVLSICTQLLCLDFNLMLEVLNRLLKVDKCKEHRIAILCMAFIARKNPLAAETMSTVIKTMSKPELDRISLCYFMCFEKLLNVNLKIFDKLFNSIAPGNKKIIDILYKSLCEAIVQNFPIVQYAGLSIVIDVLQHFPELPRDALALALNKASSLQTSRDNIKELPFPLGLYVDEVTGKVGAIAELEKPIKPRETPESKPIKQKKKNESEINSALANSEMLYSNSERIYLAKKMLKNTQTAEEIEAVSILSRFYLKNATEGEEISYLNMRSLRDWTELLIRMYNIQSLFPTIPLIKINLELIGCVLPEIFNKKVNKKGYFCSYLQDFFNFSNAGHRRLMIKILENSENLYESIPIDVLLTQLIDLQEYPKALFLIEQSVRARIKSENRRFFPGLLQKDELKWCRLIYSGLYRLRYIEAIPKQCSESLTEEIELKTQFANGEFLLLSSLPCEESNKYIIASCWRVGKSSSAQISADIENIIAYIFNSTSSILLAIENARQILIAKSFTRSAAYSQAYEHILTQHLFENIIIINSGQADYQDISKRNLMIENKFEYREIAHRVSLVIYRRQQNIGFMMCVYRDLFKNAVAHKQFGYCWNLLNEIKICNRKVFSQLMQYYEIKYKLIANCISRNSKSIIRNLWKQVPYNLEAPPTNGNISNITLKMKLGILYLKVKCLEDVKDPEKLVNKYLAPCPDHSTSQRLFLERGFYVLANYFDKFLFFEIDRKNVSTAIASAKFYCSSLKYGHSRHYHSMTRLLTLFFGICNIRAETQELLGLMQDLSEQLPLFIWADRLNQVISAAGTTSIACRKIIVVVLGRLFIKHPQQMPWFVFPLLNSTKDREDENKTSVVEEVVKVYTRATGVTSEMIKMTKDFIRGLVRLCKKEAGLRVTMVFGGVSELNLAMPVKENFKIQEFDVHTCCYGQDLPGFPTDPVVIRGGSDKTTSMHTKAAPVKITVTGSDNRDRYFLCKFDKSSDMRKESRVGTIIDYINRLLSKCPDTKRLKLRLPAYSIIYIGSDCGIVEWVDDTLTIKSILSELLAANHNKSVEFAKGFIKGQHEKTETWARLQETLRPNFHQYFEDKFRDKNKWHNARTVYTRSLAAWSVVGYIIGLGDRHCENILFIKDTSELMFIDFECIFNMGILLPTPEVVPFRLTPELQDAMGMFFEEAEFVNTCELVLECLKNNKNSLLSQFESFVSDPLSTKILNPEVGKPESNIHKTLKIVGSRLDGYKVYEGNEKFKSTRIQVEHLIKEATNSDNLRVMYFGWMPWL